MINYFDFPRVRQSCEYTCGASAIQAVLAYYGIDIPENIIMRLAKTNKSGTSPEGIKRVAKKFGLKYKEKNMTLSQLKEHIQNKQPVIIAIQAWRKGVKNWENKWSAGHYVIPIGYDEERIYLEDPACVFTSFLTFEELEERWHDLDEKNNKKEKLINWGIAFSGKPIYNSDKAVHMDYDSFDDKKMTYKKYRKIM